MRHIFSATMGILFVLMAPLYASAAYCPMLTQTFSYGANDETTSGQVTELQKFLVEYYQLDPAVYITGYFGYRTRDNVRKFQCENMEICSGDEATTGYGVVGPMTRAAIQMVCGGGNSTYSQPSGSSGSPTLSIFINNEESVELEQTAIFTVRWLSSNAASCTLGTIFGTIASTSHFVNPNTSGSALGMVLPGGVFYTFACMNSAGSTSKTARATLRPRSPCMVGGTSLQDGESRTLYSQSSVVPPTTCEFVSEVRVCRDGTLSGSSIHNKFSCVATTTPP